MRITSIIALSAMVLATAPLAQTVFAGKDYNTSRSNVLGATECKAPMVWNAKAKKCVKPVVIHPVKDPVKVPRLPRIPGRRVP